MLDVATQRVGRGVNAERDIERRALRADKSDIMPDAARALQASSRGSSISDVSAWASGSIATAASYKLPVQANSAQAPCTLSSAAAICA